MNYLKVFFVIIWKIWFYIVAALDTITIGLLVYFFSFQKNDKLTYFFMKIWGYVLFYSMGFRYTLKSSEKLNSHKHYILISNHTSLMDIALMYILHPKNPIVFVGKDELVKYPIFGRIYKKVSIVVNRSDRKSREGVFSVIKKNLEKKNKSIVIFPEGGIPSRDILLANFKDGAFVASIGTQTPIVVYAFHNLKNMFPFIFKIGYPGRVLVERIAILLPENQKKEELKEKAFHLIYEQIKEDPIYYPGLR